MGGSRYPPNAVFLNIYDLTPPVNQWTYWCGVGVFHAGVEVFGQELAYGGHDYDCSGVFATAPLEPPGTVVFRRSVYMGDTRLTPSEVLALAQDMGASDYKGNAYHLLQRNCNHFANDLCMQLVGKPTPGWVNRLASVAVCLHCMLPESLVPPLQTPSVSPDADSRHALISGPRSDQYLVPERSGGAPNLQRVAPGLQSFSTL